MKPVVLIPACSRTLGLHPFHVVGSKYVEAVTQGAGCLPLLLPPLGEAIEIDELLASVDGVMLTWSASNVHPSHSARRSPIRPCRWTRRAMQPRCR